MPSTAEKATVDFTQPNVNVAEDDNDSKYANQ